MITLAWIVKVIITLDHKVGSVWESMWRHDQLDQSNFWELEHRISGS
jgi:hypothetical protein